MIRFLWDLRGTLSLNFVLLMPVFAVTLGGAIDFARAYTVREQLQNAVDAATLAGTRMLALEPSSTDAQIEALVQAHLDNSEVSRDQLLNCTQPIVTADRVEVIVSITLNCDLDTLFPTSFGKFELSRRAASDFGFDDLDVAFMLDVSGSMGGSKIEDLKEAVRGAIDIFYNESRSDVRVAFAPYSTAFNAGGFADDAVGVPTSEECVTERNGGEAFTDAPPSEEWLRQEAGSCNGSSVLPLTNDIDALNDAVDDLSANGSTAGHLGVAWAWYLISPRWAEFWPAANAPKSADVARKAVVIMTDGMFNEAYEAAANGDSADQAAALCRNMKASGVTVFSIGFQAPSTVENTLRNCATLPNYYFETHTGTDLGDAYRAIAEELVSHTLTR